MSREKAEMEEEKKKKFIRYSEAVERYSLSKRKLSDLVKISGALYKVGNCALINVDIFDKFLESYRIDDG